MPLTVTLDEGTRLRIGDDINLVVKRCTAGRVRVTIDAPQEIDIYREPKDGPPNLRAKAKAFAKKLLSQPGDWVLFIDNTPFSLTQSIISPFSLKPGTVAVPLDDRPMLVVTERGWKEL